MPSAASLAEHVQSPLPPWVHLYVLRKGRSPKIFDRPPSGFIVKEIDGRQCETKAGLLSEFAHSLQFPNYFGQNWDALEECLADLEWLPATGYLIIVTDAERVLPSDDAGYATFIQILQSSGEEWAAPSRTPGGLTRPPAPFHAILAVSVRNEWKRAHWRLPTIWGFMDGPGCG